MTSSIRIEFADDVGPSEAADLAAGLVFRSGLSRARIVEADSGIGEHLLRRHSVHVGGMYQRPEDPTAVDPTEPTIHDPE